MRLLYGKLDVRIVEPPSTPSFEPKDFFPEPHE